jgi:DNA repair protein RadC
MSKVRFIGLDVHADTIAVAVAEPDGEVRALGVIPNRPESAGVVMGIDLVDHIVLGDSRYCSFKEMGRL